MGYAPADIIPVPPIAPPPAVAAKRPAAVVVDMEAMEDIAPAILPPEKDTGIAMNFTNRQPPPPRGQRRLLWTWRPWRTLHPPYFPLKQTDMDIAMNFTSASHRRQEARGGRSGHGGLRGHYTHHTSP